MPPAAITPATCFVAVRFSGRCIVAHGSPIVRRSSAAINGPIASISIVGML